MNPDFRRVRAGFTLLEVLLAIAILGVLLTALLNFTFSINKTSGELQNRINITDATRRLAEMMTQELRSTAFGVVASQPYAPTNRQISVLSPLGSAGNTVSGIGVIDATGFATSSSTSIYAGTLAAVPAGSYFVLLSGSSARLMRTTAASTAGTTQTFNHNGCPNLLPGLGATLSLVTPVGYRHDSTARILYERRGNNPETVLAWGVSTFNLTYTYVNTTTGTETTSTTYLGQQSITAGITSVLRRINLTVGMTENGETQTISNTVNLVTPTGLTITSYSECI